MLYVYLISCNLLWNPEGWKASLQYKISLSLEVFKSFFPTMRKFIWNHQLQLKDHFCLTCWKHIKLQTIKMGWLYNQQIILRKWQIKQESCHDVEKYTWYVLSGRKIIQGICLPIVINLKSSVTMRFALYVSTWQWVKTETTLLIVHKNK